MTISLDNACIVKFVPDKPRFKIFGKEDRSRENNIIIIFKIQVVFKVKELTPDECGQLWALASFSVSNRQYNPFDNR